MKSLGVLLVLFLLVGCTQTSEVKPRASSAAPTSQGPFQQSEDGTTEEEALEEATEEPEANDPVANFNQSYTYEDGVTIEVTKIKHGKVTRSDADYSEPVKAGADYIVLTYKVTNGSKANIKDVYQILALTYGPNGEEAETPYLSSRPEEDTDLTGTIRAGKSKVGTETFAVPKKYQDDVQLEVDFDTDRETAVFAGSVK